MKIVISRKGFDSKYGGVPSPILPDGRLLSLSIPSKHDKHTFADLNHPDIPVDALLRDLTKGKYGESSTTHLDPDLNSPPSKRLPGWRPALGQTGNPQSHLRNKGVGVGDVFLFFGWFREVECASGSWRYVKQAPHLHVMFGWLEVAHVLPVVIERHECLRKFAWVATHPHVANPQHYMDQRNTLYVAADKSRFDLKADYGGGRFHRYDDRLRLTAPGAARRTVWSLPSWFLPASGNPSLSFHTDPDQWSRRDGDVRLQAVDIGQEFVLDTNVYPAAESWLKTIVGTQGGSP